MVSVLGRSSGDKWCLSVTKYVMGGDTEWGRQGWGSENRILLQNINATTFKKLNKDM